MQGLESKKGFAEKNSLNFRLLADDKREAATAYGVLTGPGGVAKRVTFYIDPQGIVRKIDEKVSPASAGKDVVAGLKELRKGDPPLANPQWDANIARWEKEHKAKPEDASIKEELALAYYQKGYATMMQANFPPRIKYPAALRMFSEALKLNPNLAAAKEDKAAIEAVYKQMGRPVPTDKQ